MISLFCSVSPKQAFNLILGTRPRHVQGLLKPRPRHPKAEREPQNLAVGLSHRVPNLIPYKPPSDTDFNRILWAASLSNDLLDGEGGGAAGSSSRLSMPKNTIYPAIHDNRHVTEDADTRSLAAPRRTVNQHDDTSNKAKLERVYRFAVPPFNGSETSSLEPPNSSLPPPYREHSFNMTHWRQWRPRSIWWSSYVNLIITTIAAATLLVIVRAFLTRHLDLKGCDMCWSRPMYIKYADFDTEHTRFASKYELYMIKEGGIDEDPKVSL